MYRLLALVVLSSGCLIDAHVGAGGVRGPGAAATMSKTERAWTAGIAIGTYIEPGRSRYRAAAAYYFDKTYPQGGSALSSTLGSGWTQFRGDAIVTPTVESDETLTRVTAILGLGANDGAISRDGVPADAGGTPVKLFAGIGRSINDREQRFDVFSTSVTYSIGPWFSRWPIDDAAGAATLWGAGVEVHATLAIGLSTILSMFGAVISAPNEIQSTTNTSSSSSSSSSSSGDTKPSNCVTVNRCYKDPNGDERCMPDTRCN